MPIRVLAERGSRKIFYWAPSREEAESGLDNCPYLTRWEIINYERIISPFLEQGQFPPNKNKFKKVENEKFFEIKPSKQLRMVGDYCGAGRFVIFYCVRKKNGYSQKQLKQARKLHKSCLEELK